MSFFQDHLGSFKTILLLVYLQHNGRTAHFPAAHISLALRGPANSLRGVAEPRHPRFRSVQYPPRQMVCQHHWFPGHRGIQEMDTSRHLQRRRGKEKSSKHLPSLRKHSRSVNVPVELHRRDVQRHTTGRTWNHWPTRSTYQDTGWKVQLSNQRGEGKMPTWATIPRD